MSAQKILITCLGLLSLLALGGCNDVKSPAFQPRTELVKLQVCEANDDGSCPLVTNCNGANEVAKVPVGLTTDFCAYAQHRHEVLVENGDEFSVDPSFRWTNVSAEVSWSSSASDIATIDASTGRASALQRGGPLQIKAQLEGKQAQTELEVTEAVLQGIAIVPSGAIEVLVNSSQKFECRGRYSGPNPEDGSTIRTITDEAGTVFGSSDSNRYTIDTNGNGNALVATVEDQPVLLTCTANDESETPPQPLTSDPPAEVTVCDPTARNLAVEINPKNVFLAIDQTQEFSLTATYDSCLDGLRTSLDVTDSASWNSSDEAVAPIDTNGVVTGLAEGQAQITGTFAGVASDPTTVIVSNAVVGSLRIEGPAVALALPGQSVELSYTAFAQLVDADTGDEISEQQLLNAPSEPFAEWSSNSPAISFAEPNIGVATLAAGATPQSVEITASYQGSTHSVVTHVVDLSAVQSLEITPSLTCIGDALQTSLLGEPVQQLTAHAIIDFVDQDGAAQTCSAPVTDLAEWRVGEADILSALLANPQLSDLLGGISIPVLSDILGVVGGGLDLILEGVNQALGDCKALLPLTVGTDPMGSPVQVSNEPPKGQVSGSEDSISLVGGTCVQATLDEGIAPAFSSVLVVTELQAVCETLLAETEPSVAACETLQADSNNLEDDAEEGKHAK